MSADSRRESESKHGCPSRELNTGHADFQSDSSIRSRNDNEALPVSHPECNKAVSLAFGDGRFPPKVWNRIVIAAGGCWLWQGGKTTAGYGLVNLKGGGDRYLHRLIATAAYGAIPPRIEVDHLCRVRRCVNPEHLELVTHRENGLRGISPAAKNAAKTHCDYGHEFTPENTATTRAGARRCRECYRRDNRAASKARTAQRRAARAK